MDELQLSYFRFILALLLVLGLIALLAYAARRFGFAARGTGGRGARRLAVSEILAVDARRRLVLFRRDNVEHLVLLGSTQDLLIETLPASAPPAQKSET
jgi:flagellar protein FliO/FliZ